MTAAGNQLSAKPQELKGKLPGNLNFGVPGPQGPPGYTPQRGIDYYTEADEAALLEELQKTFEGQIQDMEQAIADLQYKPIAITSFTVTPARGELGEVLDGYQLSWVLSKAAAVLKLDGVELPVETEGVVEEGEDLVAATRKFTLVAADERGAEASKSCYLTFYNGVYYGAAAAPEAVDSAFVLGLAAKTLTDTRKRTVTVSAGAGEYIWYCFPKRMREATFKVGGFEGGFQLVQELAFTNALGYEEAYYIYRSANVGLGSITVEVS